MDDLLSRKDLGEHERARQYIQLQNKYLTFKQQLNSRSKESSLPYSEEQREISSNLLAYNVPAPDSRAGGSHSEPSSRAVVWYTSGRCSRTTSTSEHRSNTSDFTSDTRERLASPIHLDTPSHNGTTFAENAKTSSNPVCKLLRGRLKKVPASSQKSSLQVFSRRGRLVVLFRSLIQIYNEGIQFYSKESSGIQGEFLNQDKFADLLLLLSRHSRWLPFWAPTWILPKIRNYQKTLKLEIFDAGHVEYDIIKHFAAFCWHFVYFYLKRVKNTNFSSKMAWPPATYDVISRNQSNRFSPNLCQNMSEEYVHSYRKRQVWIITRLGKIQEKP